jgi:3-oxoacyl-[acyl-carrier protein] reductase
MDKKVCLITGASGGIGAACALSFAKAGYDLILHYSRSKESTEKLAKQCEALGAQTIVVGFDVRDEQACDEAIQTALTQFQRIDVLINNAGVTKDQLMLRMSLKDFEEVLDVNLKGSFIVSQAVLKPMMKARSGVILNMSSVVGLTGNAGQTNYAASKAGLIGFTKSLAKELASRSIRVNAIAPGFIETAMTALLTQDQQDQLAQRIPLKRFGQVDEVAQLACFLASDQAAYITGQTIVIDGGLAIGG